MSRLSKMSRLLVAAVALGALMQTASLTYYLSVESADAAMIAPIDLTVPERRNEAARFVLIHAIAEQYGITVADRTAHWQLDEVSSLKSGLDQIADRLSQLTGRDGQRMMKRLFSGIAFYRDRYWGGKIAYTIGGTVSFYDVWARYDKVGRAFYLAHELGHVWIYTHHPFLQTERLANVIGQRVTDRAALERVYLKLWAYERTTGVPLDDLLGPLPS